MTKSFEKNGWILHVLMAQEKKKNEPVIRAINHLNKLSVLISLDDIYCT